MRSPDKRRYLEAGIRNIWVSLYDRSATDRPVRARASARYALGQGSWQLCSQKDITDSGAFHDKTGLVDMWFSTNISHDDKAAQRLDWAVRSGTNAWRDIRFLVDAGLCAMSDKKRNNSLPQSGRFAR